MAEYEAWDFIPQQRHWLNILASIPLWEIQKPVRKLKYTIQTDQRVRLKQVKRAFTLPMIIVCQATTAQCQGRAVCLTAFPEQSYRCGDRTAGRLISVFPYPSAWKEPAWPHGSEYWIRTARETASCSTKESWCLGGCEQKTLDSQLFWQGLERRVEPVVQWTPWWNTLVISWGSQWKQACFGCCWEAERARKLSTLQPENVQRW